MTMVFPNIDPVALSIGLVEIRWYALAYLAGFLGGWYIAAKLTENDKDRRPNKDDLDDFLTWMVLGVILGGRLGYALFYNFEYYLQDPLSILKLWEGGMAFHGGLIGAIVAMIGFSLRNKIPFFQLADIIAVVSPVGLFFGRLANFVNGELYGRVTASSWGMIFPNAPDALPRHPSQLYEAVLEGIVLFTLLAFLYLRKDTRRQAGQVSAIFMIGYGLARFTVEFFREPDLHIGLIGLGMSMGQILCVPMILSGAALLVYVRRYKNV